MQRQALRVAVAPGEDLRPRAGPADEGIVRRHRAVVLQPHDLAGEVGEVLRLLHLDSARRRSRTSGRRDRRRCASRNAGCPSARGRASKIGVTFAQAAVAQLGARHRRRGAARAFGRVGEIEHAVLREVRMQADIEQAALAAGIDLGHAGQRRAFQLAVGEDPSRPGRSVISIRPSGRKAMLQGCSRSWLSVTSRKLALALFSDLLGAHDGRCGQRRSCSSERNDAAAWRTPLRGLARKGRSLYSAPARRRRAGTVQGGTDNVEVDPDS